MDDLGSFASPAVAAALARIDRSAVGAASFDGGLLGGMRVLQALAFSTTRLFPGAGCGKAFDSIRQD
jgi:hypothetical protein